MNKNIVYKGQSCLVGSVLVGTCTSDDRDCDGRTALIAAAYDCNFEILTWFLDSGLFDLEDKSINGRTALAWACEYNRVQKVKELLRRGANLETRDINGWTPLFHAIGHFKLFLFLLGQDANLNAEDWQGNTTFMIACRCGKSNPHRDDHNKSAMELLKRGEVYIDKKNKHNETALIYAAWFNNPEMTRELLKRGADTKVRNNQDKSALDYARVGAKCGRNDALKVFREFNIF